MQTKNLIQRYYDYFNNSDMNNFLKLLHENIKHDINQGETQVGKDAFEKFMQRMNHSYKETVNELIIMLSEDNQHAAAEFVINGVYLVTDDGLPPANKQHYSLRCGAFFEIKDGLIYRVTNYYNMKDWINQVSL